MGPLALGLSEGCSHLMDHLERICLLAHLAGFISSQPVGLMSLGSLLHGPLHKAWYGGLLHLSAQARGTQCQQETACWQDGSHS